MSKPATAQRFEKAGTAITTSKSPADFSSFVQNENARWAKIVKDSGLLVQ